MDIHVRHPEIITTVYLWVFWLTGHGDRVLQIEFMNQSQSSRINLIFQTTEIIKEIWESMLSSMKDREMNKKYKNTPFGVLWR